MIPRDFLNVLEAAAYCGLPVKEFRAQAAKLGLLFKFMGRYLVRVCDLEFHYKDGIPDEGHRKLRKTDQERARRASNPEKFAAKRAAQRAARIRRTPAWANKKAILAVYRLCREMVASTGIAHHVDHLIPLQGRLVSGLHVHDNLQVLTGAENVAKGNRFTP